MRRVLACVLPAFLLLCGCALHLHWHTGEKHYVLSGDDVREIGAAIEHSLREGEPINVRDEVERLADRVFTEP